VSDLDDHMIDAYASEGGNLPERIGHLQRMAKEIRRHRAATAADRERVRQVVRDVAFSALCTSEIDINTEFAPIAGDIAARTADRLATPAVQLSRQEREDIEWHIETCRKNSPGRLTHAALKAIERLLGVRP
jgi:hypothetical protein